MDLQVYIVYSLLNRVPCVPSHLDRHSLPGYQYIRVVPAHRYSIAGFVSEPLLQWDQLNSQVNQTQRMERIKWGRVPTGKKTVLVAVA